MIIDRPETTAGPCDRSSTHVMSKTDSDVDYFFFFRRTVVFFAVFFVAALVFLFFAIAALLA